MKETSTSIDFLKATLGPIKSLLDNPDITDILVFGHDKIGCKLRGKPFSLVDNKWANKHKLYLATKAVALHMDRSLDENNPILDGRLPDKSRVSIIAEPCYESGAGVTIRKFPENQFTLQDIARFGSIDERGLTILEIIVRMEKNILIAGGTGSGKTTILNSLCGFIPQSKIVVTVEDAREISISNQFWYPLQSKRAKYDGDKEITLRHLVVASLRMNPQWVIVGEVRGPEAYDLVRAFNTGHAGMGTIHASSAYDALLALESLVLQSGTDVPRAAKEMVSRAIHIVIYARELPDHSRKILEIIEVQGLDYSVSENNPTYKTRTLYRYDFSHYDENEKAVGRFIVEEPPSWADQLKLLPKFKVPEFWQNRETDK